MKEIAQILTIISLALFLNSCESCSSNNHVRNAVDKFNSGDQQGAIISYDKAIEINPNNSEAFRKRGYVKFNLVDYTGAKFDYDKAINLDPRDEVAYYYRGLVKFRINDFSGALTDFNKIIELNPNSNEAADAYEKRSIIKVKTLDDIQGALIDLNKAIRLHKIFPGRLYIYRGTVKYKLNDKKGACEDWHKASEQDFLDANELIKNYCN
jgi:tetratricopeptide (TPR) repeat protein